MITGITLSRNPKMLEDDDLTEEDLKSISDAFKKARQDILSRGYPIVGIDENNNLVRIFPTGHKIIIKKMPPRKKVKPGIYKIKKL